MKSNYNKEPEIRIKGLEGECVAGWAEIAGKLKKSLKEFPSGNKQLIVECYQGVDEEEILNQLLEKLEPETIILTRVLMFPPQEIQKLTYPDVTDDRIFGHITRLNMENFFDPVNLELAIEELGRTEGLSLIIGPGASLLDRGKGLLVYADMARWEIQLRMRRNEVNNLGLENNTESFETQYKRGYFVDWRVCDRLKKKLMPRWDYVLDTNRKNNPRMITGKAFLEAMNQTVSQPFSVVPYFDAGPWGGQWMKDNFDLDPEMPNYAWCFNCVPEENSLYLRFGEIRFETPAINLVFCQSYRLLGDPVQARFGDEFPIRFDFLDTMGGGNLSLQVHPLTDYIRENFGIPYTQDESYYLVEADEGAKVYLGLKEHINPGEMAAALKESEVSAQDFDDMRFVNSWPARKHDHFLIPGGTVHCSGKDCMVLEISSTPYIFTFKLWDWGRMGLDGKPRPINIDRGLENIQWERTTSWVEENLLNRIEKIAGGEGWIEEKTGLHKREFIETRRHWFTGKVSHHTGEGVNVLALVEGDDIIVESPSGAFEPLEIHYAEVFIVPACVGEYSIRPGARSQGKQCATIKAYVRTKG